MATRTSRTSRHWCRGVSCYVTLALASLRSRRVLGQDLGRISRRFGQDWAGSKGQPWSLAVNTGYLETLEITGVSLEKPWSGRRESNPRSQLGKEPISLRIQVLRS